MFWSKIYIIFGRLKSLQLKQDGCVAVLLCCSLMHCLCSLFHVRKKKPMKGISLIPRIPSLCACSYCWVVTFEPLSPGSFVCVYVQNYFWVVTFKPSQGGEPWEQAACTCSFTLLTLGVHAQQGLWYLVRVSVCLFVYIHSRTTGYQTAHIND